MIYITEPGDTPSKIAYYHLGYNDSSFASRIRSYNRNSFAIKLIPKEAVCFAPCRAIWVPSEGEPDACTREDIINAFDWFSPESLDKTRQLQRSGIDGGTLAAGYSAMVSVRQNSKKYNELLAVLGITQAVTEVSQDVTEKYLEAYKEAYEDTVGHIKDMAVALKTNSSSLYSTANKAYRTAYAEMQNKFSWVMKYMDVRHQWARNPRKAALKGLRYGWNVLDTPGVKKLEKAVNNLKIVNGVLFSFSISEVASETYNTYRDGQDWKRPLLKGIADMAFSQFLSKAAGALIVAIPPPFDIYFAVPIITGTGVAIYEADQVVNRYIDEHF